MTTEPVDNAEEPPLRDASALGQLDPQRARRAALDALLAYREATDAPGLAAVFATLADTVPAHWLLTGLLSVASQLVEYLAASEEVDPTDVLKALASLESGAFDEIDDPTDADDRQRESPPAPGSPISIVDLDELE